MLTVEILDAEADSAQLNGVKLLDFVVKFALGILEGAHDKPESVNRFFVEGVIPVVHKKLSTFNTKRSRETGKLTRVLLNLGHCFEFLRGVAR